MGIQEKQFTLVLVIERQHRSTESYRGAKRFPGWASGPAWLTAKLSERRPTGKNISWDPLEAVGMVNPNLLPWPFVLSAIRVPLYAFTIPRAIPIQGLTSSRLVQGGVLIELYCDYDQGSRCVRP
jgi:hypothetical protein